MTPKDELLFLALGGSGEIGMNVNLYGCQGKWVMVDLGMTFGDPTYPGIELILPDLTFIEERRKDLLGIVLTHGHEDHIGAIPYLAADLGVPLYATPFTAGLIRLKLEEEGLTKEVKLHVIQNEGSFNLGPFGFRYVPLAHSIPEGNALLIDTPHGKIFHTGDWKLDERPLLGEPATPKELTAIGDEGILAMVCDSTNVFNDKASGSEGDVREGLMETIAGAKGRVLVTTFASNAARVQTLGEVATATGRKVCVAGRSLDRIIGMAKASGYLKDFPPTVDWDDAMALPRNEVMIIATGGQGEARAALARVAFDSHPIKLAEGDLVVFSSKQIPGNEIAIGRIQNALAMSGVLMVTDRQAEVHVSGHPGRPELEAMYRWIRPEILLPVHGERRHMAEQARLALASGIRHAPVQSNGDLLRLAPGAPEIIGKQDTGRRCHSASRWRDHQRTAQIGPAWPDQRRRGDRPQGQDDRQADAAYPGGAGRGRQGGVPGRSIDRCSGGDPQGVAGRRRRARAGSPGRASDGDALDGQEADSGRAAHSRLIRRA